VSRPLVAGTALAAILLGGCGGDGGAGPRDTSVAEVNGRKVSVQDLDAYLANNLVGASPEEPVAAEDLDRVKSRLLDGLLDEELLAAEAERRGIRVTDEEIDGFVASGEAPEGGPPPAPAKDREVARRELLAQKVREADASEHAVVSPEEVDAYLRSNADRLRARQRVQLRSLRFADTAHAARVREDIVSGRISFEQAARGLHGKMEESRIAVTLGGLPEPVRAAVAGLTPGQVSAPVTLDGTTFLFRVESGPDAAPGGPEALRDLARAELLERRYREASKTLVVRLRTDARVVVHPDSLPFRYVPDETPPR
jgi:parvulin-like peptidyl-prolyl isomerase